MAVALPLEPEWKKHMLKEPDERVREVLEDSEEEL